MQDKRARYLNYNYELGIDFISLEVGWKRCSNSRSSIAFHSVCHALALSGKSLDMIKKSLVELNQVYY